MVDEFLWELGRGGEEDIERRFAALRALAAFTAPVGVFEELRQENLLAFAGCWLLEHGGLRTAEQAETSLEALEAFCRWAEESQEVPLWTSFGDTCEALHDSVPRLVEANRRLERADAGARVELVQVAGIGEATVTVREGEATSALAIEPSAARHLEPGDWLRVHAGRVVGAFPEVAEPVLRAAS
jgi:hypothetical protein